MVNNIIILLVLISILIVYLNERLLKMHVSDMIEKDKQIFMVETLTYIDNAINKHSDLYEVEKLILDTIDKSIQISTPQYYLTFLKIRLKKVRKINNG